MLYLEAVQKSPEGVPVIVTDLVSSNKRRVYDRAQELTARGQHCRIMLPHRTMPLSNEEFRDLR